MSLKPFWRYFGGKYRSAPKYPRPTHRAIVEPFAGAAGYSLRYPERDVILVERYAVVAEMWRYLIAVQPSEVRRIPCVEHTDDLPSWVPQGARWLVGFTMNAATDHPCRKLSAGRVKLRSMGRIFEGWSEAQRERVATQVESIRHWRIIEGDYTDAPDVEATWYIDPPYVGMTRTYKHGNDQIDYPALGAWCQTRRGQVLVCENEGADWLPFRPFAVLKPGVNGRGSREVLWSNSTDAQTP
jgi:hypothetical protein